MKKILFTLLLAAFTVSAQVQYINVGTNLDDHTGENFGHYTCVKMNYDFGYLDGEVSNVAATVAALPSLPTNVVYSTTTVPLLSSNPFVFSGGSNYLGYFTNVFSFTSSSTTNTTNVMNAGGGWLSFAPTNPYANVSMTNIFTNSIVYNYLTTTNIGTNTYNFSHLGTNFFVVTNVFTNVVAQGIQLAVKSSGTTTGAVAVAALSVPALTSRYIGFAGQTVDFANANVLNLSANGNSASIAVLVPGGGTNHIVFTNGLFSGVTSP